jgi:RHS repeat-associated protein
VASVAYDADSRVKSYTYPAGFAYPAGFSVSYSYNTYGYLSELVNASNSSVIWQANKVDAAGHITNDSMAGGAFTATRGYDALGRLQTVQTGPSNTIQNDEYWYDGVGNLSQRSWIDSSDVSHTESFGYDPLNRLTSVTGPANKLLSYDGAGNLTYKSDVGTYNYTAGTHQISSILGTVNGIPNPSFTYDSNGNIFSEAGLSTSWTSFNMPSTLTRGTASSTFVYGPEHQRIEQVATSSTGTVTTYYVGSSFERVTTSSTGVTENHYHISAYGRRIAMLVDTSNTTTSWRYFHQDHLSTVEVVTDQTGALVERLSYDAWGKRRNLDGTDSVAPIVAADKRGYTDQEELDNVSLVHMNARIYDPVIARFISPDPIIPQAFNLQTHNRYEYALNQPLALTDPSGFDPTDPSQSIVTITYADGSSSTSTLDGVGGMSLDNVAGVIIDQNTGTVTFFMNQDTGNASGNSSMNSLAPDNMSTGASYTMMQPIYAENGGGSTQGFSQGLPTFAEAPTFSQTGAATLTDTPPAASAADQSSPNQIVIIGQKQPQVPSDPSSGDLPTHLTPADIAILKQNVGADLKDRGEAMKKWGSIGETIGKIIPGSWGKLIQRAGTATQTAGDMLETPQARDAVTGNVVNHYDSSIDKVNNMVNYYRYMNSGGADFPHN